MPGEPTNTENPPAPEQKAPEPAPVPQPDPAELQKQLAAMQEQYKQVVATLASMQPAPQQAPQPPEPEITPEFAAQAQTFFRKELAPFLQQMDQRFQQLAGWQSGQQLRQLSQEIELPNEVEAEVQNVMATYAKHGRPVTHENATAHVLGLREMARLKQEATTRRTKQPLNNAIFPTFGGAGGLPNLQPNGTARPKDNDINGWAALADQHDLPLS